jgi:hypothetical protein
MSIIRGLKAMEGLDTGYEDGPKTKWLKLANNQSATIRFINELDEDSPNYNAERNLALIVSEHINPMDFRKKAVCTLEDEGRCFACEMYRKETKADRDAREGKSWRPKYRFYINLLVNDGLEAPYVAVWSQGVAKQSAFPMIKEFALEQGSITNREWKVTRKGEGTATNYVLFPRDPDTTPFDWKGIEPYELEKVVWQKAYAEQEDFFLGFEGPASTETKNLDW